MVAREAVENALRHSGASSVAVRLSGTATSLQLEISDDGVGITTPAPARTGHLGILGMHERAQAIGATVVVDSGDGTGTRVSFSWQCAP
jgi:signal transduction histidine kinase